MGCDVFLSHAGRECENILLVGNSSGAVQCTTPSQPLSLPYYPGNVCANSQLCTHYNAVFMSKLETTLALIFLFLYYTLGGRGLLREVWIGGNVWRIDEYLTEPRSPLTSIQERAYRDNSHTREFGERHNFNQRYSGFFVPPVTSLYTFSILSDDLSRFYVSRSMNADDKELVAYADRFTANRWNRFESQTSAPRMMERGQYYYIEAYSNQGGGMCMCIVISTSSCTQNCSSCGHIKGTTPCSYNKYFRGQHRSHKIFIVIGHTCMRGYTCISYMHASKFILHHPHNPWLCMHTHSRVIRHKKLGF